MAALVTDIGNDILYGASAYQITRWVEQCLDQLQPLSNEIVVTRLPIESLETLGPLRFLLIRTILFPKSRLSLQRVCDTALELDERVAALARKRGIKTSTPVSQWYGLDPIHVRRRYKPAAWQQFFAEWYNEKLPREVHHSPVHWLQLRGLRPQRRRLFGFEQLCSQPSTQLADGSLLSLF